MQLYERLLGTSFARLPAALRRFHARPGGTADFALEVTHEPGRLRNAMASALFLALLFPNAAAWLAAPAGSASVFYGWMSWVLSAFAVGVGLSGIRDLTASFALPRGTA